MHREMIVNGQFYPDNSTELNKIINAYTPEGASKIDAKGAIVPHAGYVFSGEVCGDTLSKIVPKKARSNRMIEHLHYQTV